MKDELKKLKENQEELIKKLVSETSDYSIEDVDWSNQQAILLRQQKLGNAKSLMTVIKMIADLDDKLNPKEDLSKKDNDELQKTLKEAAKLLKAPQLKRVK